MAKRVRILGIPVDAVTRAEVLRRCSAALRGAELTHVVTANPEILLLAHRDDKYAAILQQAGPVLPDGIGLVFAARFLGQTLPERIPGVEFFVELCRLAVGEGKRVYLLGGWSGVSEKAAERLRHEIPALAISAFAPDHSADEPPIALWDALTSVRPALLFVAYGAPEQERWIAAHRKELEMAGVRIAMGVGGAFDILAGKLPRAPRWMRALGLEWLWRLCLEPQRLLRILRATILFPLAVMREKSAC